MKDDLLIRLLLEKLYEAERKQAHRNFAKDHSLEEWIAHYRK